MLHPGGIQHEPKLYGAVTAECVSRAEISAPHRPRAICMAMTSNFDVRRGRPSSWSASVDRLCFGDETARRLFLISARNIDRAKIPSANYLSRTDLEPIFNPAQAWNALTVGAFTEKTNITDPTFQGWSACAKRGTRTDQPHILDLGKTMTYQTGSSMRRRKLGDRWRDGRFPGRLGHSDRVP